MNQRTPLSKGASVRKYIIDNRIGDGASCLVYEAHYLDSGNHRKEIILKECYPYNAGITRVGSKIIWSDPAEQDNAFSRFDTAYEAAAKIQNTAGSKSVSVYSLDKFEENGTQYVATIPNGNSYDKNESEDIADIIRTALALTNAVGLYHKVGYLHLDIKPSNFIATEDQTGKGKNIVLFDVDTVVSQEDVQSGNLRSISYSKEFAAPEQKMQQIKKICPATDLFAVGAVLFERIMNRSVECFDSGLFATWEYDSRFDVKKVNPKVKRLLTEIFHKTLAANVKRRYQSADELAGALDELVKIVDGDRPYIYSPNYVSTCNFVGRSEELAELHKALADGKPVFVNGAGGIGKTELVKKYVSLHQDEYDAIVFMLYNGSVSECLNEIEIIGIDSEDKDNKSLLKEICDENVLLILDNFDIATDEDDGLEDLLALNSRIIITTRTDFSEIYDAAHYIKVSGLPTEDLRIIFENGIGHELSDIDFYELHPIIKLGKECTYFWSMVARLAKAGAYSISEIVKKVTSGLDDLEVSEKVIDTKDGIRIKRTVAKAMSNLFVLDKFGDKEFEVLMSLSALDFCNLDITQIRKMLSYSSSFSLSELMNAFNDLTEKGYIQKLMVVSREVYRVSNVLKGVLEHEIEPDVSRFEPALSFMDEKMIYNKGVLPFSTIMLEQLKGIDILKELGVKIPEETDVDFSAEIDNGLEALRKDVFEKCNSLPIDIKSQVQTSPKKVNINDIVSDKTEISNVLNNVGNLIGDSDEGLVGYLEEQLKNFEFAQEEIKDKLDKIDDNKGVEVEFDSDESSPNSVYITKKDVVDTLEQITDFLRQISGSE